MEALFITARSHIEANQVYQNGRKIFQLLNEQTILSALYGQLDLNYPKFYKMDHLSQLAWLATEVLLEKAELHRYKPEELSIILSNRNQSLDADLAYFKSMQTIPSPAQFVYTLPNIMIGEICIRHGIKGENTFYAQAFFDPARLCAQVNYLLQENIAQACICGWVEYLLDDYKAVLFLVEKKVGGTAIDFTEEHVQSIFNFSDF